jgi:glycosyltransferase involved in cell wall biosynthesis
VKATKEISAVIPTRNRPESLARCLESLTAQTHPLKEVIVVDAGDDPLDPGKIADRFPHLPVIVVRAQASVCVQRNKGIRRAGSTHVFLCDDDIELPPDYIAALAEWLTDHPDCGAVSGVLHERSGNQIIETIHQPLGLSGLLWRRLFQLTVWTDLSMIPAGPAGHIVLQRLKTYYRNRNNTFTLAGWPLVTRVSGDHFRTAVFGLGAALVRKEWLLVSPYDEILDPHGIGDNYGVTINFPGELPITVLRGVAAVHHRSDVNRLAVTTAYYRRILALDYFMRRSAKFTAFNRVMLLWSLLGNLIPQVIRFDIERTHATCKAALLIALARNPYVIAAKSGDQSPVTPLP